MNILYQACLCLFVHEEGQEFDGQINETREIGSNLRVEGGQVNFLWLCKVDRTLDSGIQEDAVQLWASMCDAKANVCQNLHTLGSPSELVGDDQLSYELVHALSIGNIELYSTGLFFTMAADEIIESVLSTAHCDDFGAFLDKAVSHCGTDARCGADHEDRLVLESHVWDKLCFAWTGQKYRVGLNLYF